MIWLSLFACGLEWTGERLPVSDFNVQHVLRLEGEELLVAGNASRNSPHDGKVFLRTAPDTYELVWQKRNALDVDDIVRTADTLWMITSEGRPGSSLSHVYCSEDEGRTWTHQSELPWGVHGGTIDVASDGALWIRTGRTVNRSTDHGRTWTSVLTPPERERRDRLYIDGDDVVLASPRWILRTRDGSVWTKEPAGLEVEWMDARFVGGGRNGKAVFGPRGGPLVELDPDTQGHLLTAAAEGDEVWALATRHFGGFGFSVGVFHSSDAGRTWSKRTSIMAPDTDEAWSIDAHGLLFSGSFFDFGRLWVRRPWW